MAEVDDCLEMLKAGTLTCELCGKPSREWGPSTWQDQPKPWMTTCTECFAGAVCDECATMAILFAINHLRIDGSDGELTLHEGWWLCYPANFVKRGLLMGIDVAKMHDMLIGPQRPDEVGIREDEWQRILREARAAVPNDRS